MDQNTLNSYLSSTPIDQLDIPHFIEKNLGYLLVDRGFSRFLYSSISEEKKADALLAFLKTRSHMEHHRPHKKGDGINEYEVYCSYSKQESRLSLSDFYEAFSGFFTIPLLYNALDCSPDVVKAIRSLLEIGESQDQIMEFLHTVYNNPSTSFVPSKNSDLENDSALNYQRKMAYANAKRLLMPIANKILDAICVALTDFEYNDILLENNAVLHLFASALEKDKTNQPVMIVEPTSFLIKRLYGNNPLRNRTIIFVLGNQVLVDIYSKFFENKSFQFVFSEDLDSKLSTPSNIPTDILVFGTHIKEPEIKTNYIKTLLSSARDKHTLFFLDADNVLKCGDSSLGRHLSQTFFNRVWLFPEGIQNSTMPIRKTLLQTQYGYCDSSINVFVTHFRLSENEKNQFLMPYMFNASLSIEEAKSSDVSFRNTFWVQYFSYYKKTSQKRKSAISYCFSAEIMVYYRLSGEGTPEHPFRLSAYVREPGDKKSKAAIIDESKKSTKKVAPNEIEQWIKNDYLRDDNVRVSVINSYQRFYENKPITLRSFVYINQKWSKDLPSTVREDLFVLSDSILGDLYLDRITSTDIESVLEEDMQRYSSKMSLLSDLFDVAILHGHCSCNPAKSILRQTRVDREDYYQVRANLTRKNLSREQFIKLYIILNKQCAKHSQVHLAAMICLLLGLDANIVCALKWRDLIQITTADFSFLQICIQRQLNNDGTEIRPFTSHEQFRLIPCPSVLTDLLFDYYQLVLTASTGLSKDLIKERFIFGAANSSENTRPLFSPQKLRKEIRNVIKKLELPPDIITIPDNAKGTTETNLAYYQGDLFRMNFHYYARHIGKFEAGEIEYFLGLQASTTFSRNYCDYSNVFAQYILFIKLERVFSDLFRPNIFSAEKKKVDSIDGSFSYRTIPDTQNCTSIGIQLTLPADAAADIIIDTKHGASIMVQHLEGNK